MNRNNVNSAIEILNQQELLDDETIERLNIEVINRKDVTVYEVKIYKYDEPIHKYYIDVYDNGETIIKGR